MTSIRLLLAVVDPAAEAVVDGVPGAEVAGEVAPGDAGAGEVEQGFEKSAVGDAGIGPAGVGPGRLDAGFEQGPHEVGDYRAHGVLPGGESWLAEYGQIRQQGLTKPLRS